MARLPQVGGDASIWGDLLNEFLKTSHNDDGSVKDSSITTASITQNAVTTTRIADGSVTAAKLAAPTPTTGQVLGYSGSNLEWTTPTASAGGSGITTLADATDVAIATPSANQFLGYNPGTSKWVNTSVNGVAALSTGGGVETLNALGNRTGATALNLATGNVFSVTLTGATNFTITGATAGTACSFGLYLKQDASGSRVVSWPASVKWPAATAPTLTTTAAATDIFVFESIDGGTTWFGSLVGADYR